MTTQSCASFASTDPGSNLYAPGLLLAGLGLAAWLPACKTAEPNLLQPYVAGDYPAAEKILDDKLAEEHHIPKAELQVAGTAPGSAVGSGDQALGYLEKSMLRLSREDAKGSLAYLTQAEAALDKAWVNDWKVYADPTVIAGGDAAGPFRGADYEHILVRVMLAFGDIFGDHTELVPRAHQIVEVQEKICNSKYGEAQSYKPREHYKRVAIGQYLSGLLKESDPRAVSEAHINYQEALKIDPDKEVLKQAVARTNGGEFAPQDHGVVHVFYLGGQGPDLEETQRDPKSNVVDAITRIVLTQFGDHDLSALFQAPVKVPKVRVNCAQVPPLRVRESALGVEAATEALFDVNEVASQQLEANMPMILARSILRRGTKEFGVEVLPGGDNAFLGATMSFGSTAIEHADTRCWTTLPASVQVARLTLPKGAHELELGPGMKAVVDVKTFQDSMVLVLQPNLSKPGVVLVDATARVAVAATAPVASVVP